MSKVTAGDTVDSLDVDICATWAAIQGLTEMPKDIQQKRVPQFVMNIITQL